jgi:NADH-quinone oxidoreductase subunit M
MVLLGVMKVNLWFASAPSTTLILGAAYSLWMVKRVIFGDIANDNVRTLTDINARELTILAVLALLVLFMGLYPKPFTDVMHVSVDALLKHVAISKL